MTPPRSGCCPQPGPKQPGCGQHAFGTAARRLPRSDSSHPRNSPSRGKRAKRRRGVAAGLPRLSTIPPQQLFPPHTGERDPRPHSRRAHTLRAAPPCRENQDGAPRRRLLLVPPLERTGRSATRQRHGSAAAAGRMPPSWGKGRSKPSRLQAGCARPKSEATHSHRWFAEQNQDEKRTPKDLKDRPSSVPEPSLKEPQRSKRSDPRRVNHEGRPFAGDQPT